MPSPLYKQPRYCVTWSASQRNAMPSPPPLLSLVISTVCPWEWMVSGKLAAAGCILVNLRSNILWGSSSIVLQKKPWFMDAQLPPRILGNQNRVSMDIQDPEVQAFALYLHLNKLEWASIAYLLQTPETKAQHVQEYSADRQETVGGKKERQSWAC